MVAPDMPAPDSKEVAVILSFSAKGTGAFGSISTALPAEPQLVVAATMDPVHQYCVLVLTPKSRAQKEGTLNMPVLADSLMGQFEQIMNRVLPSVVAAILAGIKKQADAQTN